MGTSVTMMRQGKVAIPYMARAASKHNICGKLSLTLLTCLPCARLAATVVFRTRLLSVGVYSSSGSCQRWRKGVKLRREHDVLSGASACALALGNE